MKQFPLLLFALFGLPSYLDAGKTPKRQAQQSSDKIMWPVFQEDAQKRRLLGRIAKIEKKHEFLEPKDCQNINQNYAKLIDAQLGTETERTQWQEAKKLNHDRFQLLLKINELEQRWEDSSDKHISALLTLKDHWLSLKTTFDQKTDNHAHCNKQVAYWDHHVQKSNILAEIKALLTDKKSSSDRYRAYISHWYPEAIVSIPIAQDQYIAPYIADQLKTLHRLELDLTKNEASLIKQADRFVKRYNLETMVQNALAQDEPSQSIYQEIFALLNELHGDNVDHILASRPDLQQLAFASAKLTLRSYMYAKKQPQKKRTAQSNRQTRQQKNRQRLLNIIDKVRQNDTISAITRAKTLQTLYGTMANLHLNEDETYHMTQAALHYGRLAKQHQEKRLALRSSLEALAGKPGTISTLQEMICCIEQLMQYEKPTSNEYKILSKDKKRYQLEIKRKQLIQQLKKAIEQSLSYKTKRTLHLDLLHTYQKEESEYSLIQKMIKKLTLANQIKQLAKRKKPLSQKDINQLKLTINAIIALESNPAMQKQFAEKLRNIQLLYKKKTLLLFVNENESKPLDTFILCGLAKAYKRLHTLNNQLDPQDRQTTEFEQKASYYQHKYELKQGEAAEQTDLKRLCHVISQLLKFPLRLDERLVLENKLDAYQTELEQQQ